MITINVPESLKQEQLKKLESEGLKIEVITDDEYIKRFGKTSFERVLKLK